MFLTFLIVVKVVDIIDFLKNFFFSPTIYDQPFWQKSGKKQFVNFVDFDVWLF